MFKTGLAIIAATTAKMAEGPCPTMEYNKSAEEFDKKEFTGLWFEYVWEEPYSDYLNYKCAMWTLLEDGDNMVAFNHLSYGEDQEAKFAQLNLNWATPTEDGQPQYFTANRFAAHMPEQAENRQDKEVHMVHTNYYSYAIGQTCQYFPEQNMHETAAFAWVREKQPSMYMRNEMRKYMLEAGIDIGHLVKGPLVDCWGKDIY